MYTPYAVINLCSLEQSFLFMWNCVGAPLYMAGYFSLTTLSKLMVLSNESSWTYLTISGFWQTFSSTSASLLPKIFSWENPNLIVGVIKILINLSFSERRNCLHALESMFCKEFLSNVQAINSCQYWVHLRILKIEFVCTLSTEERVSRGVRHRFTLNPKLSSPICSHSKPSWWWQHHRDEQQSLPVS